MTSTGADIPAAVREFRAAGWTVRQIADDLRLHVSTIYRWAAGTRRPNAANFEALTELVDARYSQHVHRRQLTLAALHLQRAAEALETDAEREVSDRLAAEVREHLAAGQRRRDAEVAQCRARFEQGRDSRRIARQRKPVTSITAQITDPFALVGAPEPALPF